MDAQYAAVYPELYTNHWWWRVREEILLRKIRSIVAGVSRPRILDVGCGAALFFDALHQLGHVEGIESDRAAVEKSGRWRSHIVCGELDESYEPDAPFDLILMLDVLEHVTDPERLLRRAGQILTPGGRILVTAPSFNCLWTTHDDLNRHLTRYTTTAMRRTIRRAGLVTVETSYMFQSLIVPKLLVRLREALTAAPARVPRVPRAVVNDAIRTWYRVEYALAGWLPFGGSLLAVAANTHEVQGREDPRCAAADEPRAITSPAEQDGSDGAAYQVCVGASALWTSLEAVLSPARSHEMRRKGSRRHHARCNQQWPYHRGCHRMHISQHPWRLSKNR